MLDDILADIRGRVTEMRAFASKRREVTSTDPVADATDYWADYLETSITDLSRRMVTVSAAQYAKIHGGVPGSVRRWCERGELAGAQKDAAGEWRIPRGAVRRHVRGQRRSA